MPSTGDLIETNNSEALVKKKSESFLDGYRDEDVRNLLLYYMKRTFNLRIKGSEDSDETSHESDRNVRSCYYSASTDYDSEEEQSPRKSSLMRSTIKCKYCSKLLRGIDNLKNHYNRKHGKESKKEVLCDKCPTRFRTDLEFNRHYQTHCAIKNYSCHLCSKKFYQKSSLDLHIRYHKNEKRYQCDICRKKFFTKTHFKRHSLTHSNKREFRCDPCKRSFRYKDHLQRHLQNIHIGVRSNCCRVCHKSFMYLSQLKFHEESHKKLPIKCSKCKKRFRKRILFKKHQRQCKK